MKITFRDRNPSSKTAWIQWNRRQLHFFTRNRLSWSKSLLSFDKRCYNWTLFVGTHFFLYKPMASILETNVFSLVDIYWRIFNGTPIFFMHGVIVKVKEKKKFNPTISSPKWGYLRLYFSNVLRTACFHRI